LFAAFNVGAILRDLVDMIPSSTSIEELLPSCPAVVQFAETMHDLRFGDPGFLGRYLRSCAEAAIAICNGRVPGYPAMFAPDIIVVKEYEFGVIKSRFHPVSQSV
jgi:hypothetical protein